MTQPEGSWQDAEGLRWYTFNDKDYLSVTSMRKSLGIPYTLHRWVMKQTLEAVQKDPSLIVRRDGETLANVRTRVMKAGESERDKAAERGTEVHDIIASDTLLRDVPPELRPYVEQYARAVIDLGIRPLLVERTVYNDRYGYAGSFDLLAQVKSHGDRIYIIDLKTGKGTYPEYALQVYAYLKGEFIAHGDRVDEKATSILKKAEGAAILHITPDKYEWHPIRCDATLDRAYRSLGTLSNWVVTNRDLSSLLEV